ncbi:hypothetical protein CBL_09293 [Carabus blaptoides fortunei]
MSALLSDAEAARARRALVAAGLACVTHVASRAVGTCTAIVAGHGWPRQSRVPTHTTWALTSASNQRDLIIVTRTPMRDRARENGGVAAGAFPETTGHNNHVGPWPEVNNRLNGRESHNNYI